MVDRLTTSATPIELESWLAGSGKKSLTKWKPVATILDAQQGRVGFMSSMHDAVESDKGILKVIQAFASDHTIKEPLPQSILQRIAKQFETIDSMQLEYADLSVIALKQAAQQVLPGDIANSDDSLRLLAIIREAINRFFGIIPYNTQMLAILAFLDPDMENFKGAVAQVKTGEGKSTLVAMLAAYQALQGKNVDVVSSSRTLAERDAVKYHDFYAFFDISCGHICIDLPDTTHFKPKILFGTNTDFEFSLLRDLIHRDKVSGRERQVCIVDEVDNLIIDKSQNSAIISIPAKDTMLPLIESIYRLSLAHYHATLHPNADQDMQDSLQQELLKKMPIGTLLAWQAACRTALFEYQENIHYIISKDKQSQEQSEKQVIIIEESTGELQHGSRWQNRIHQFIELKHGLPIKPESIAAAEINHLNFFTGYKTLYGLTGTLGNAKERHEICTQYQLKTFDVPTHQLNQRKQLPLIVCQHDQQHFDHMLKEIKRLTKADRPILFLFKTIEHSLRFAQFLTQKDCSHQIYNAIQNMDKHFLIERAGLPGMVTIATNMAGRGTDIQLHPISMQQGGLHVVLTYFPESVRVEEQGIGRSARQGQPGSSRLIINAEQIESDLKNYRYTDYKRINSDQLNQYREAQLETVIQQRLDHAQLSARRYSVLKIFAEKLQAWFSHTEFEQLNDLAKYYYAQYDGVKASVPVLTMEDASLHSIWQAHHDILSGEQTQQYKIVRLNHWLSGVVEHMYQQLLQDWAEGFATLSGLSYEEIGIRSTQILTQLSEQYFDHPYEKIKLFLKNLK